MSSPSLLGSTSSFPSDRNELDEDQASTIRQPSPDISDNEGEGAEAEGHGDYSARMEELLDDDEDGSETHEDEDDGEGGFLYTGMDAEEVSGAYRDQLRDVLGPDHEEDETDEFEVESSLLHHSENEKLEFVDDEPLVSMPRARHALFVQLTASLAW